MFNLTVSEAHTFYVGTNGWLVHNQQVQPYKYSASNPAPTSDAARREAMRRAGIPTSAQPSGTFKTGEGYAYTYEVPKPGGGNTTYVVNFQNDDLHGPHWEVGQAKMDGNKVLINGKSGAPKYYNEFPDGSKKIRVEFKGC